MLLQGVVLLNALTRRGAFRAAWLASLQNVGKQILTFRLFQVQRSA